MRGARERTLAPENKAPPERWRASLRRCWDELASQAADAARGSLVRHGLLGHAAVGDREREPGQDQDDADDEQGPEPVAE